MIWRQKRYFCRSGSWKHKQLVSLTLAITSHVVNMNMLYFWETFVSILLRLSVLKKKLLTFTIQIPDHLDTEKTKQILQFLVLFISMRVM